MRGRTLSVLVGVGLAAAIFVPAAAAKAARVKLALVPLQHAQLGAPGRSLRLAHDSGPVSNTKAAANAMGNVSSKQLAKLGRVTGYQLDYGNPFLPGTGIREIQTGIELYKSGAGAKRGFAFWRKEELRSGSLAKLGVRVRAKRFHMPKVGAARWAYVATLKIPNTSPVYVLDERLRAGRYVVDVSVAAGALGPVEKLAPRLAKKVDARLRLGLAGKLRGRPAKLPPHRKPGPPPRGPVPATAALATSDFTQATLSSGQYVAPNLEALSEYDVTFAPADSFDRLFQQIVDERTASESTYYAALLADSLQSLSSISTSSESVTVTPVDVSSVGDDAYGALIQLTVSGQTVYEGAIVLVRGPIVELLIGAAKAPLAESDVTSLAQAAAAKLDAAVAG